MGQLRLIQGNREQLLPLSASTRVGRHWSCDVIVNNESVPLYWLEIRWRGNTWGWRTLSAESRTRSRAPRLDADWFALGLRTGGVRLDNHASEPIELRMVSEASPELLVEDLQSRLRYSGGAAQQFLEIRQDGRIWPLSQEPLHTPPLRDGDVFAFDRQLLRAHIPQTWTCTTSNIFDVMSPKVWLTLKMGQRQAVFSHENQGEITISGEQVRILMVYAKARCDEDDLYGGWLTVEQAYEEWVALGGNVESRPERMGWERGKLRTQLAAKGVVGLDELFESRRLDNFWEIRLKLPPDRISLE